MIFYIKNFTNIVGLNDTQLKLIKEHLTINNPIFHQRIDMGLSNWGVPRDLIYYQLPDKNLIRVPTGAVPDIVTILKKDGAVIKADDFIDARFAEPSEDFFSKLEFKGELRSYQQDIINSCMSKTIGVIEAQTGSGKTITFVALTVKRKVPTLILVNTIELANQVKSAFLKFTNVDEDDIGMLGNGKFEIRNITVGLHQTMANLSDDHYKFLNEFIGQIIADEVHIVAAKTFFENMEKLNAKYKFGFSATPYRDDGLTKVINFALGPKIHVVPKEELKDILIKPSVEYINTNYYFPIMVSEDYIPMIGDLCLNKERNQLIYNTWKENYQDNWVIMLCSRVDQVLILHELIGDDSVFLVSNLPAPGGKMKSMKKKDRAEVIRQLQNKEKKVVISTYGLFSTGIDIPHLDTLFMCSPIKSSIKVKQSAGRLMRKSSGKSSAKIVDFVDHRIDMLKSQAKARRMIYSTL